MFGKKEIYLEYGGSEKPSDVITFKILSAAAVHFS
jgi:hypothetical protein